MRKFSDLTIFNVSAFLKAQVLLLPVLYLFYLSNGLSWSDYFLFQGIAVLINVILQLPIGLLGNYVPRKWLIFSSYFLYLGRIILWLFFHGYIIVLLGEVFAAISKSLFDAVESPYIYDILKDRNCEDKMLKSYSKFNFAISCGTAIASIIGTWLYSHAGLQVLLSCEFLIISGAILLALKLPVTESNSKNHYSLIKFCAATKYIFKHNYYVAPILYSGLLVSFSHFFFWSFQPLMKEAFVPVMFFGVVVFVNNVIRAGGSLYTSSIMKRVSLDNLGLASFMFNLFALVLLVKFFEIRALYYLCLAYILFLCICIALQLMFTIATTSYLQQKTSSRLRGYIASITMFVARFGIAAILILPKYLSDGFSLIKIYNMYAYVFLVLGLILLLRFLYYAPKLKDNVENSQLGEIFKKRLSTILLCGIYIVVMVYYLIQGNLLTKGDVFCFKKIFKPNMRVTSVLIRPGWYGDTFLAQDLGKIYTANGYTNMETIINSPDRCQCIDYHVNLVGAFWDSQSVTYGKKNILWIAYSENGYTDYEKYLEEIVNASKDYDAVIISSIKVYNDVKDKLNIPSYLITQFTNADKFYYDYDESVKSELLFVGNAHFDRKSVAYSLKNNFPIDVYGEGHAPGVAKAKFVDNSILRKYYSSAKIVLNDTGQTMKNYGFVSNRIIDATACGAFVISDYMPEIAEIYGDSVPMWKNEKEFAALVKYYLAHPQQRQQKAKKAQQITLSNYTNKTIDKKFIEVLKDLEKQK